MLQGHVFFEEHNVKVLQNSKLNPVDSKSPFTRRVTCLMFN